MLRILQQTVYVAARSYYRGRGEYHLGISQELPAIWDGRGAQLLGLTGKVERADLDALCDSRMSAIGRRIESAFHGGIRASCVTSAGSGDSPG